MIGEFKRQGVSESVIHSDLVIPWSEASNFME